MARVRSLYCRNRDVFALKIQCQHCSGLNVAWFDAQLCAENWNRPFLCRPDATFTEVCEKVKFWGYSRSSDLTLVLKYVSRHLGGGDGTAYVKRESQRDVITEYRKVACQSLAETSNSSRGAEGTVFFSINFRTRTHAFRRKRLVWFKVFCMAIVHVNAEVCYKIQNLWSKVIRRIQRLPTFLSGKVMLETL